ncbi:MAG: TolC family protein [Elusimicrobium sp.]|jgi:outer membrane protein TolC|nr:TolC family protein [Elusimicrobium sp.]
MKKVLILFFVLCAAGVNGQEYFSRFNPSAEITLETAIRLGLENNTQLLAAAQSIMIAQSRVSETSMMRLPQFDLLATATSYDLDSVSVLPEALGLRVIYPQQGSSSNFYGASVSAVQYLYSGGRISGSIKMSRANLKEEQSKYETEKNKVILKVKLAFYNFLYATKYLELAEKNYAAAQNYAKKQNPRNSWERVSMVAAAERFRAEINTARRDYRRAYQSMLENLNKELDSEIKIKGDFKPFIYENEVSKLNLWAMQFRPELQTALYEVEMYNLAANISLGQKYPDVILGASFEKVGENTLSNTNKQISLAVRLPLLYSYFTQPKQKKAQQKQSALRRADLEDSIRQQVLTNFDNLMFWQQEIKERESSVAALSKEIKKSEAAGVFGIESLDALEAYHKAQASYLEAVKENLLSKAQLEWAVGQDL